MFGIRDESIADAAAIGALTSAAFAMAEHASGTEAAIVAALREAGALTLSLVAAADGEIVGHAAFSPVTIGGSAGRWFGLGPVSVRPDRQSAGIGTALIAEGLARLRAAGAGGCVVLGDPGYYRRFGFLADPSLFLFGVPAGYFQILAFRGPLPAGEARYHAAFGAA